MPAKELLINVQEPEECRVAVVEQGTLEEFYLERSSQENLVGNIYKGRITNLEPSIQAAFVDFGVGRNGFLHVSDIEPNYFQQGGEKPSRGHQRGVRGKPPIQDFLRRGQEVVVQVIKEGIGHKGPTLSTYLSIPGRYLVLMPGLNRVGVSRKIASDQQRDRLRELLSELQLPSGLGFIIRTAGADRTKKELARDLAYLLRLWKLLVARIKSLPSPATIFQETDLVSRTIRDIYTPDIETVWIDEEAAYTRARELFALLMPRYESRVKLHAGPIPLFQRHGIEPQIERIHQRRVPLPGGGSLVIDSTEALVAIDVNSGTYRTPEKDAEATAFAINRVAAREIARQLRLRDLGGVIVNDFIDMLLEKNRKEVERTLRDAVARDRARTKILRMSQFGIIEMTRQRVRSSIESSTLRVCLACGGTGLVKSAETVALDALRHLQAWTANGTPGVIEVQVAAETANYLQGRKRASLDAMETGRSVRIQVVAVPGARPDTLILRHIDPAGRVTRQVAVAGEKPSEPW